MKQFFTLATPAITIGLIFIVAIVIGLLLEKVTIGRTKIKEVKCRSCK